jgi:methionyl-tRNA synthetase
VQKYNGGIHPDCEVSVEVKERADRTILEYERLMSEMSFDKVFDLLNIYLRDASKDWSARCKNEKAEDIESLLTDSFHVVKTAAALFHPITPISCEMIREYLCIDERIWDWKYIFEPLAFFTKSGHKFKFLEPRIDFFKKHPSQFD